MKIQKTRSGANCYPDCSPSGQLIMPERTTPPALRGVSAGQGAFNDGAAYRNRTDDLFITRTWGAPGTVQPLNRKRISGDPKRLHETPLDRVRLLPGLLPRSPAVPPLPACSARRKTAARTIAGGAS